MRERSRPPTLKSTAPKLFIDDKTRHGVYEPHCYTKPDMAYTSHIVTQNPTWRIRATLLHKTRHGVYEPHCYTKPDMAYTSHIVTQNPTWRIRATLLHKTRHGVYEPHCYTKPDMAYTSHTVTGQIVYVISRNQPMEERQDYLYHTEVDP